MLLIIIPVKNEAETIERTTSELMCWCNANLKGHHILFIDDHSTDKTFQIVKKIKHPNIKIFKNRFENGKGSALKVGYVFASLLYALKDDDLILFMDGDGQIQPKDINVLLRLMRLYDADVVIGNKRHLYSVIEYSFKRKIISESFNFICRLLLGIKYKDTQCGIKLFKKHAFESVADKLSVKKYAMDLELLVALG